MGRRTGRHAGQLARPATAAQRCRARCDRIPGRQRPDFPTSNTPSHLKAAMKTLFLQAPSFDGFDGGAGSRYQAKREIKSFWFPTWLAQPAAMVPGSRVVDAPADGLSVEATLQIAEAYELVIIHTSTPSFPGDALFAEKLKARKPLVLIGMVGAKVAVDPHNSLAASDAIDFVCREEFDFTCMEVSEGKPLAQIL